MTKPPAIALAAVSVLAAVVARVAVGVVSTSTVQAGSTYGRSWAGTSKS